MAVSPQKERITLTLPKVIVERLKREADESAMQVGMYTQLIVLSHFKQADAMGMMKGLDTLLDKLSIAQLQQLQIETEGKGNE
jgi:hypothetical protein